MRYFKYLALLAVLVMVPAVYSQGQVALGVRIGSDYGLYNAPPVCEYGFYPDYPYGCAPYGYWGPDYFVDGVFIGVGPWFNFYHRYPGYWNGFFVGGGFRDRGFRGFRDGGFRRFDRGGFEARGFRGGERGGFDRGRGFVAGNGFRGGDHGFRGGSNFHASSGFRGGNGGRSFSGGGGRSFSGGGSRGGSGHSSGGGHGGSSHGGRR
jgi:hypothetical protein